MKRRLAPNVRKDEILAAALTVAELTHYAHMTRNQIAIEAGVSGPTVQHYFGTMARLRRSVMRAAINECSLVIIAQGLIANDVYARGAPKELRDAALANVIS